MVIWPVAYLLYARDGSSVLAELDGRAVTLGSAILYVNNQIVRKYV